jgi:hypothetical protein
MVAVEAALLVGLILFAAGWMFGRAGSPDHAASDAATTTSTD